MDDNNNLVESTITVPKNTGVTGFIHTIKEILKLSRVQSIHINSKGVVEYKRYVSDGEHRDFNIDFSGIEPYGIIRNGILSELIVSSCNAAVTIISMLDMAHSDNLYPVAFVTGANSTLWDWYKTTTGFQLSSNDSLCGLPLYTDRQAPDSVLILCAAHNKTSELIDTHKSYKIDMSVVGLDTTVEVI